MQPKSGYSTKRCNQPQQCTVKQLVVGTLQMPRDQAAQGLLPNPCPRDPPAMGAQWTSAHPDPPVDQLGK